MGDVVVTRADREAAALVWCGPEGAKKPRAVEFIERGVPMYETLDELALTIARVRIAAEQRTREECAAQVEEVAALIDSEGDDAHECRKAYDCEAPQYLEGVEEKSELDARKVRALAERMLKGGG